jgi:serine/threonine protein kinase
MTTPVPPSSRLPNVRPATGTVVAEAERWVTDATREFLRQQGVKLLKPLGKAGAYGAVFEATDSMQRPLAVKIVKNPSDRESRKRHLRECQVLSAGKIPADLAPYCYMAHKAKLPGEAEWNNDLADGVQPFLVMSRIPGREVHEYVGGDRPLAMTERLELVSRLFEALARLHECGLVHGDPSPRNVLVEKDHRVRFVDLGGARDIGKVIRSMMSTMAVGGTPGYAPKSQLLGTEQAAVWTDIRAMSAVAFDALTGQRHDDTLNIEEKRRLLQASHVPAGVIRIILKGLREPDGKVAVDPSVYSTADEVVAALRMWRLRRARMRQALLFVPLLVLALAAMSAMWWQREATVVERQWQTARVLLEQVGKLSQRDSTGVRELVEQAESNLREVEVQGGGWTPLERSRRLGVAADVLRRALEKGRRLDALTPRYTTLGEILNKIPWQPDARGVETMRVDLEAEYLAVGKLLDAGDADQAEPRLTHFAARLISGWEANERARTVGASRAEFDRLFGGVPARLQSAARYGELKADAAKAKELWHAAHTVAEFELADKSFGSARQRLTDWLDAEESPEEKSARLQEAQSQVKVVAEQLLAAQAKNSQLASEIDTLKTQIANQTKLNQDDRLARQSAESQMSAMQTQLQGETTKRKAAEAKLAAAQGLADRVPQLEASLKSTQEALAKERGLSAQLGGGTIAERRFRR